MQKKHYIVGILILAGLFALPSALFARSFSLTLICDIWPPYQIQAEKPDGFSTKVVKAVLDNMGAPIVSVKAYPWQRALSILQTGDADVLFSANHVADREAFALYPEEPIIESPWLLWTAGKQITSLEDIKGMTIGVVRGYSYTREFWNFIETYCTVEEVHSDEINFLKLSMKRVDVVAAELGNGVHIIRTQRLHGITPAKDVVIKNDGLYALFSKKNVSQAFVKQFSAQLKAFKQTKAFDDLYEQYFSLE